MILVLPSFLVVINHLSIDLHILLDQGLFLARILTSSDSRSKTTYNLKTISKIVLHSGSTGLIVIHIEHLTKILGRSIGPPVSNKKKHDCICMVLHLDILIHPDLTQYVNGLYAKPLACSMGQPTTTSDI